MPAVTTAQMAAFSLRAPIGSTHLFYGFVCHPGHERIAECFDGLQIEATKLEPHLEPAIPHFGTPGMCSISTIKLLQRALVCRTKPETPLWKEAYPEDILWELACTESEAGVANSYANANANAFAQKNEPMRALTPQVQKMLISSHPQLCLSALSAELASVCAELSPSRSKEVRPPGMDVFGVQSKGLDASASLPFTKGFNDRGAAPQRDAAPNPEELGGGPDSATRPDLKRLIIPAGGRLADQSTGESAESVREQGSILAQVGVDLDALARAGKLDPVIGREDMVRQILEILLKRRKPNVCLVGDAGCGKTALAEAVAVAIAEGAYTLPPYLDMCTRIASHARITFIPRYLRRS